MIEPIIITKYGEALKAYPESEAKDPEEYKLTHCIGVHAECNGFVDHVVVSSTHVALRCRACQLRVVIPKEIDTWAKLQARMEYLPQVKDMSPLRQALGKTSG